jgi:hypothetical protein
VGSTPTVPTVHRPNQPLKSLLSIVRLTVRKGVIGLNNMSIDYNMAIWCNWQTHNDENVDLRVLVGSSPTIATTDMEMEMSEKNDGKQCSFAFTKDNVKVRCTRKSIMEIDGFKFCKLHSEVYVLENFDVKKNFQKDPGEGHG